MAVKSQLRSMQRPQASISVKQSENFVKRMQKKCKCKIKLYRLEIKRNIVSLIFMPFFSKIIAIIGEIVYNERMEMGTKNSKGVCRIICAGERSELNFDPKPEDLTIAADGGYDYAVEAGIVPDIVLGDFDSVKREINSDAIRLNPVKDVTDTFAAVETGLGKGYKFFEMYCCTGGRTSHTLANIATLRYIASRGGSGVMKGKDCEIYLCDRRAEISGSVYFSLIPSGDLAEVEIENAAYSGTFLLTDKDSLGVSNEPLKNKTAAVTVHSGEVVVIIEQKN